MKPTASNSYQTMTEKVKGFSIMTEYNMDDVREWNVADTVRSDRKDFFCFVTGEERHIGTFIAGSREYLIGFQNDVCLMRRSPEMKVLLEALSSEYAAGALTSDRIEVLAEQAAQILREIEAPYKEGFGRN